VVPVRSAMAICGKIRFGHAVGYQIATFLLSSCRERAAEDRDERLACGDARERRLVHGDAVGHRDLAAAAAGSAGSHVGKVRVRIDHAAEGRAFLRLSFSISSSGLSP
jgi:hypothetical protein